MRLIDADELRKKAVPHYYANCIYAVPISVIDEQPTIEQPQWIPVTERLPDEGGTYLVCQDFDVWGKKHKVIGLEQFVKQLNGWFCDGTKITNIAYWMKLPNLPMEDERWKG